MLREDQNRSHRDTVSAIRRDIKLGTIKEGTEGRTEGKSLNEAIADLKEIDDANIAYIRAKTEFSTVNSDRTMINLIGTWARLQRVIWKMDDKYGSRE